MTPKGDELESIAVVEPGTSLNVPLKAVYTPPYELFFSVSGYSVTCVPYIWKNLQQNLAVTKVLQCPAKPGGSCTDPFIIKVRLLDFLNFFAQAKRVLLGRWGNGTDLLREHQQTHDGQYLL